MTLYRRGHASLDETEAQLADIADEVARLETRRADLRAQHDLAQAFESKFADAEILLSQCRDHLEQIEQTNNDDLMKRQIVELLVSRIRVDTEVADGRKNARLTINYTFTASRERTDGFSIGTPTTEPYSVQLPS
jgi:exonuclease VII small subunit